MARNLGDPADFRLVVAFLRSLRKWSQEELSRVSGVDRALISDYELGKKIPTRKTLQRLASAVGLPYRWIEKLLPLFRSVRLTLEGDGLAGDPEEGDASEGVGSGLDQAFVDAVMPALTQDLMELAALVGQSSEEALPKAEDRVMAAELWATLETLPPERWRLAVERERKYWTWSLAERLCAESETAATDQAARAAELAGLALRVAELSPGTEAWRWRLQGYAYAFVANARRVKGDLPGAEEAFLSSDRLWEAGAPADPGLLDGARRLELKSSLR
jgi:transcriptional regulator with XRE-family HTH domain